MDNWIGRLTEEELRCELRKLDVSAGPLTSSTRPIFEKLLKSKYSNLQERLSPENFHDGNASDSVVVSKSVMEMKHNNSDDSSPSSVYYGVHIQLDNKDGQKDGSPIIFEDKSKALEFVKNRNVRFKSFTSKADAINFSVNGPGFEISSPVKSENLDKSTFNSLKTQELSKLRKAIERGDKDFFNSCVWSNPRYLVSCGDTAVILQEGCRYNALHIAVKSNKLDVCCLVLDTIQEQDFMHMMFPDDPDITQALRMKHLLDSYLNTPDKGANETPLHFAVKFGFLEIVKLLTSHPVCNKERLNKFEQKPCDIICLRVTEPNNETKLEISNLLKSQYYVPLLRSEGNTVPAIVGKPWSPDLHQEPILDDKPEKSCTLRDPNMSITAFLGPMSPDQADYIYKRWKTSSPKQSSPKLSGSFMATPGSNCRSSPKTYLSPRNSNHSLVSPLAKLRFCDLDKGYERIGRNISKEENLPWTEYWSFLGCWVDLTSEEGLTKLEVYLKENFETNLDSVISTPESSLYENFSHSISGVYSNNVVSPVSQLCQDFKGLHIASMPDDEKMNSIKISRQSLNFSDKVIRNIDFDADEDSVEYVNMNTDAQSDYENILELTGHHIAKAILDASRSLLSDNNHLMQESLVNAYLNYFVHIQKFVNEKRNGNFSTVHSQNAEIVYQDVKDFLTTNDLIMFSNIFYEDAVQLDDEKLQSLLKSHLVCIFKIVTNKFIMKEEIMQCSCSWIVNCSNTEDNVSSSVYTCKNDYNMSKCQKHDSRTFTSNSLPKMQENQIDVSVKNMRCWSYKCENSSNDSDSDSFYTPPSSLKNGCDSPRPHTPPIAPPVFINRTYPSKVDLDVLRAIEGVEIIQIKYPFIYYWKTIIDEYSVEEKNKWNHSSYNSTPKKRTRENSFQLQSPHRRLESPIKPSSPTSYLLTRSRLRQQL